MHYGPCSVSAGLSADLGEVDPITEAPCSASQPLRLWEHSEYPRRTVPVGAKDRYGHATQDEWVTGARDPWVLRECRCPVAAGSTVPTYMTGASEPATCSGPADVG